MAKQAIQRKSRGVAAQPRRISPLDHVIRRGRFGADHEGGPGVTFALRHPVSICTVIARKGKANALSTALSSGFGFAAPAAGRSANARGGTSIHWCGPEQWYVVREDVRDGALYQDLVAKLGNTASVSDQSHGRLIISVSGPNVRDVLAKGTPVDFHPKVFSAGGLQRSDPDGACRRSHRADRSGCVRTVDVPRLCRELLGVAPGNGARVRV